MVANTDWTVKTKKKKKEEEEEEKKKKSISHNAAYGFCRKNFQNKWPFILLKQLNWLQLNS